MLGIREVRVPLGHRHRRAVQLARRADKSRQVEPTQLRRDADRRQILLDRLRHARPRIDVLEIELGREAVALAGLRQQRLGLGRIVRIALILRIEAAHRRRQHLARHGAAVVQHLHQALLVDRHVDGAPHAHVVERLDVVVHRHVVGVELAGRDEAVLERRVLRHLGVFGRREDLAQDVRLVLLRCAGPPSPAPGRTAG